MVYISKMPCEYLIIALAWMHGLPSAGTHLPPAKFHEALANPNSIVVDVRNFNETLIGRFAPPPPAEGVEKVH